MTGPTLYERWNVSISEELPRPVVVKSRTRLPEPGWYGWRPTSRSTRTPCLVILLCPLVLSRETHRQ